MRTDKAVAYAATAPVAVWFATLMVYPVEFRAVVDYLPFSVCLVAAVVSVSLWFVGITLIVAISDDERARGLD